MKRYLNIIAFIVTFIGLLVFMEKVVKPLIIDVARSDLFLEDTSEEGGPDADSATMIAMAYAHCSTYIENQFDDDTMINFAPKPLNFWNIKNYQYVINAQLEITDDSGVPQDKKFACEIKYTGGAEGEPSDFEQWSIEGLSGLD